jgi:hypothetical protein
VSFIAFRDPSETRRAVETGVREAFAGASPDVLAAFARSIGREIPPPDQPLKLSVAAERGAADWLKRQAHDDRLRVKRSTAMAMLGCGQSKLLDLESSGALDSVMSGGSRLISVASIYRLLIRESVISNPHDAPPLKAPSPPTAFRAASDRIDGRKLRRTRTQAELDALARSNQRRKEEAAARRAGQSTEAL